MLDYSQFETEDATPNASSMIETFRAIGYGIEGAIADIVDNSVAAHATNVWIDFEWRGADSWLSIRDDGDGMDESELVEAMRPGSKNPLDDRRPEDLGRFGLGLKTASFSQCRKLSVMSKRKGRNAAFWTWDLDFVNQEKKWKLIRYLPDQASFQHKIDELESGTIVIWNDLDRLVKGMKMDDEAALDKFLSIIELIKKHLAMVFHRFMGKGKLKLHFKDRVVEAWDPFLTGQIATQAHPNEPLQNGLVTCKGYILPHKSKLTDEDYKSAEGPKGWNEQQGFYIYRNERLLLAGDWLGLFRKEEHYKLARIQIDLPNSLDSEWQIDIKKSIARPPFSVRDRLKAYATKVRSAAVEVYRHRGKTVKKLPGQKFVPLWAEHKRGDKWFYKINREHPVISEIKKSATSNPEKAVEQLIRFVEETIPTKSIYIKEAEESEVMGKPFEGIDQEPIRKLMQQMYGRLTENGKSPDEAKSLIAYIEPFNHFPHFLETLS
jgi:hypothetical protein